MHRLANAGLAIVAMTFVARTASASEVCVSCSGPAATYRCTVDEATRIESVPHANKLLRLMCITELARSGGHEKCRVLKRGQEACPGLPRTVDPVAARDALLAPAAEGDAGDSEAPIEKVKPGPPQTVEELARRTASSEPMKDAGRAVRKSWRCVVSLFRDC